MLSAADSDGDQYSPTSSLKPGAANGHEYRFIKAPYVKPVTAPNATTVDSSARADFHLGNQPEATPTQPAHSIWNGSHGPIPAVMAAERSRVSDPITKPNRGP